MEGDRRLDTLSEEASNTRLSGHQTKQAFRVANVPAEVFAIYTCIRRDGPTSALTWTKLYGRFNKEF